ncbi:hypothetical protein BDY21DRAFT_408203 [Lineolata rhizophorae]|uniref:Phospholipid/glycerol acyltransferase domain-containing protein n=1 Tax=Lineolata rhizophorae TaxID=578093 RepID=A0A6A6P8F6_9PEZI|nr:hypothetical protein BDY21DRAFT_408203 [Lineolata rhizophorae]
MTPLPSTLTTLRAALFLIPWLLLLLAADAALSLLLLLKPLAPRPTYDASSAIACGGGGSARATASVQQPPDRTTSSDLSDLSALVGGASAVVVANHVAWADFYLIQEVAARAGMLSRCRWFAKSQLRWVPFLGWGLWAMGMPLVTRKWASDRKEMRKVFDGIVEGALPIWLISYSEGTRYTPSKHASTTSWCAAHNKPTPTHTLYPRTRGFVATVQALRRAPHVRFVLDVTVAYARVGPAPSSGSRGGTPLLAWLDAAAPSFWQSLTTPDLEREGYRFYVHVDAFEVEGLPREEEGLAEWLEARWEVKGKRLEGLRRRLERGEETEGWAAAGQ